MQTGKGAREARRAIRSGPFLAAVLVAGTWLAADPAAASRGRRPLARLDAPAAAARQEDPDPTGGPPSDRQAAASEVETGAEPTGETSRFTDVIVVTGSRRERPIFDEPATLEAFSTDQLRVRQKPVNLVDVFRESAAVSVQKTAQGQGSPFIRGFTGYHNLLLIDGVRFNNSVLRSGPNQYWATVDLLASSQVELIKGPASMLYGSDAVGGTVNVLTRSPGIAFDGSSTQAGRLYTRWAEAESSSVIHAELEGSHGGRLGYTLGAAFKDFGDSRAGSGTGRVVNSAFDEYSLDAKLHYRMDDERAVTFLVQAFRQDDVPRTETTVFSKPFRGTLPGSELRRDHDQERLLSYVRYRRVREGARVQETEYTLSIQRTTEGRIRVRGDGRADRTGFEVGTIGAQAQFGSLTRWGTLTYGAEVYRDSVDSFRLDFAADGSLLGSRIQGPIADDASYSLLGLYFQDEVSLSDDRWLLVVGGRLSQHRLSADRVEDPVSGEAISLSDEWSNAVGSLRVLWRPQRGRADKWRVFASLAQAFRAPNLSDLTSFDATSAIETPTPGLTPERYLTLEAGFKLHSPGLDLRAAWFHTRIEDQIVQSPTGRFLEGTPEVQKSNVGDGFLAGVEMTAEWRPAAPVALWGAWSWMEGEVDQFRFDETGAAEEVRAPTSRLVPWMANAGVRYRPESGRFWVEVHGTAYSRADRLALRDETDVRRIPPGGTPGFAVLGVRAAVELGSRGLTLAGAVENLLDEDYRIHGSGQNMPGRNLVLTLDWGW